MGKSNWKTLEKLSRVWVEAIALWAEQIKWDWNNLIGKIEA